MKIYGTIFIFLSLLLRILRISRALYGDSVISGTLYRDSAISGTLYGDSAISGILYGDPATSGTLYRDFAIFETFRDRGGGRGKDLVVEIRVSVKHFSYSMLNLSYTRN